MRTFQLDPDHHVDERDDCDVLMTAPFHLPEPFAEIGAIALHVQVQRMGALDEELLQVDIPRLLIPTVTNR